MTADPNTAEHIQQLVQMREHYLRLGSRLPAGEPMDREAPRLTAIIGSIDQVIQALLRSYEGF